MTETLEEAALSCVARNWAVFPLVERDKIPAVKGGFKAATDDADQIRQAWGHRRNMNVGVATGSMSRGLVVIDLDVDEAKGENGLDTLHEWEKEHGELPETVTAITGSGGMHLYYACNTPVGCSVDNDKGVDVRGDGGYVVVPPSVHPGTGRSYEWENHPDDFVVAKADHNVYAFIRSVQGERKRGAKFRLPDAIADGKRNDTLMRYAASMQARGDDDILILSALEAANKLKCKPPLPQVEIEKIVESVTSKYRKGESEAAEDGLTANLITSKGGIKHNEFGKLLINQDHACFVDGAPAVWDGTRYACGWDEIDRAIVRRMDSVKQRDQKEVRHYVHLQAPRVESSDATLIAFRNGVLDIVEGLKEYDSGMVITNVIPHDYDQSAYCEDADRFLDRISCGSETVRSNLEEAIGLCMYRSNEFGQCPVLLGGGSNGKSTYIAAVRNVLGVENVSSLDLSVIGRPFQAGRLLGKLANLGDDISNEFLKGDVLAVFKKIVTGEWIYTDVKNGEGFEFKPYCTLMFSANEFPNLGDSSDGMMRRLFPIPFDAVFKRDSADYDPRLWEKLTGDDAARYFVRVGIEGLQRVVYQNGMTANERSASLVSKVRTDNNNVLQWVEDERVEACDIDGVLTAEAYEKYTGWCEVSGVKCYSKTKFTQRINSHFGSETVSEYHTFADGNHSARVFRVVK